MNRHSTPRSTASTPHTARLPRRWRLHAMARAAAALLLASGPLALQAQQAPQVVLPTGLQIVSGQASVATQGASMTVRNSANAILNWSSFNIGAGAGVHFDQASAASKVLNRVTGNDPSNILGGLTSNGQVWLLNPNGVLFGRDARIDVGALVTSTLRLNDNDFLAGRYRFNALAGDSAGVRNEGALKSSFGGQIVLLGDSVTNTGSVEAPGGSVVVAASRSVDLVDTGVPNLAVRVQVPAGDVVNLGKLTAPGGRVNVWGGIVNQLGVVAADTLGLNAQGHVTLRAADTLMLGETSRTTALGAADGARGGQVDLLGPQVGAVGQAEVDVSGSAGGGGIRLGGGLQGKDAEVPNARAVFVGGDVALRADAIAQGDGGRVIVWADEGTRFAGLVSARGAGTGSGGFAEVSGKGTLEYTGRADLTSPLGALGTLLLDPQFIVVQSGSPNINGTPGSDLSSPTLNFNDFSGTSTITAGAVNTQLTSANVTLQALSDITVNAAISHAGANALTLQAGRNIAVNSPIAVSGGITLSANDPGGSPTGAGAVTVAAALSTSGTLAITNNGGTGPHAIGANLSAGILSMAGNAQINTASTWTLTGASTIPGLLSGTGSLTKAGAGTLTLAGANTYSGSTTVSGGVLQVNTLANGGVASSIGASSNAAANLVLDGGTLRYTGASVSTDRLFTLGASGGTLDSAGSEFVGGLTFSNTGSIAFGGAQTPRTLTFAGTGNPSNAFTAYFNPQIGNAGTGAVSVAVPSGSFWRLAAANTYSGGTTVDGGGFLVAINTAGSATGSGLVTVASGGRFSFGANNAAGAISGNIANSGSVEFNRATAYTYSSVISGSGGVSQSGGAGATTLTGANTYTGQTSISGPGTIIVGAVNALPAATVVSFFSGGNLVVNQNQTIGGLSGAGNVSLATGVAFGVNTATTSTFTGLISGNGSLAKLGTGTLTLGNANSYGGGTAISAGRLVAGVAGAIPSTSVVTVSGGALDLGATTQTVAGLTMSSGSVTNGSLTSTSAFTLSGGTVAGTLAGNVGANVSGTVNVTGTLGYSGVTAVSGNLDFNNVTPTTVAGINMSFATLGGSGDLTVTGPVNVTGFNANSLSGAGTLTTQGTTTVNMGSTVNSYFGVGKNWINQGTLNIAGDDGVNVNTNKTLTNAAAGVINLSSTSSSPISVNSGSALTNAGTINKTAATSQSLGAGAFNNTGTVNLSTGTLNIGLAGTEVGSYVTSTGTTLEVSGRTISDGFNFTGAGALQATGGTLTMATSTGYVLPRLALLNGATLTSANDFTISGAFDFGGFSGVTLAGAGTLTTLGATTVNFGSTVGGSVGVAKNWINQGTLNIAGDDLVNVTTNKTLTNAAAGVINLSSTSSSPIFANSGSALTNAGTINKTASASQNFGSGTFNNTGTVNLNTGTLNIGLAGTEVGSYVTSTGATLEVSGRTISDGFNFTGAGALQATGGTLTMATSTGYVLPRLAVLNGATLTSANDFTISGAFDFGGFSGVTLAGAGTLTTLGATTVNFGSTVGGSVGVAKNWINQGTLNIAGDDLVNVTTNKTLTNAAAGVINLSSTSSSPIFVNSGSALTNAGTINKTASASQNFGSGTFNNAGTVNLSTGTLNIGLAGTEVGSYVTSTGATLEVSGRTISDGFNFTGAGALQATGGTLTMATSTGYVLPRLAVLNGATLTSANDFTISGAFDFGGFSGVTLAGAGTLTTLGATTVNFGSTVGGSVGVAKNWINQGTLNIAGDDLVNVTTNKTLTNAAAGVINLSSTSSSPIFANSGSALTNAGTINKTASASQNFGSGTFNNAGTVNLGAAALTVPTATTQTGTLDIASGATLTASSDLTNASTGVIQGAGTLNMGSFTLTNQGTIRPGGSGAASTLSVNGNVNLSTGTLELDLGGTGSGQSDRLAITGNVTLGGSVNTTLIGGYSPANADFIPIVTATGTRSGTFAAVNGVGGFEAGYSLATGEAARLIYTLTPNTKVFSNAAGNLDWGTAGNWTGGLPGAPDTVLISAGYAVAHASGSDTIAALTVSGGNSLTVSGGSLTVTGATTLGGAFTVSGSGAATLAGGVGGGGGATVSGGTLSLGGVSGFGSLALTGGLVTGSGSLTVNGDFARSGGTVGGGFSTIDLTQTTGDLRPGALQAGTIKLTTSSAAANLVIDDQVNGSTDVIVSAAGALQVLGDVRAARLNSGSTQTVTAGSILLRAGAAGVGRSADLSAAGSQDITTTGSGGITLLGGGANNSAAQILSSGGDQTFTLAGGTLALTGGSGGTNSVAIIGATRGAQSFVGANAITLSGGSGGTNNRAAIVTAGNQNIDVGAGGLTLTGGVGTNAQAAINQDGTVAGSAQSITVRGGGTVLVQGGASPATGGGLSGGSFAFVDGAGASQVLNFTAGGSLTITGGTVGSGNEAQFQSSGTQTVSGNPVITITGGASGGIAGDGNGASLYAAGAQTVSASTIALQGGAAGVENAASIDGSGDAAQRITTTGALTIRSGAGGAANLALIIGNDLTVNVGTNLTIASGGSVCSANYCGGAGIGALPGVIAPTRTTVTAGGNITLTGASVPNAGAFIGDGFNSTQPMAVTVAAGGDITLNPGTSATAAGAFIGTDPTSTGVSGGSLTVSAPTGRVLLNGQIGGAPAASTQLRTPGALSITARTLDLGSVVSGATIAATGSNGITLRDAAALSSSAASGNSLTLTTSTGPFVNSAGAGALATAAGARWLVYSANPANDTVGGLAATFRQYNAPAGTTPLGTGSGLLYSIAPTLTASLQGPVSKVYDRSTAATLAPANFALAGALAGDTVTVDYPTVGSYDTAAVGAGKTVSASGMTATVVDAVNAYPVFGYAFNGTATGAVGTIAAATLTITGTVAANKVYDTTTAASVSSIGSVTPLAGDSVTLGGALVASFADKNAGTAKRVSVTGYTLSGADAGNYVLVAPGGVTADITPRALAATGLSGGTKVYDASTAALLTGAATVTPLAGDVVALTGSLGAAYADKNVGANKAISVTGLTLTGVDAANYTLQLPVGLTGAITPASLLVGGLNAASRVYDATTLAQLTGAAAVTPLAGDTVSVSGTATGSFANKTVGTAKSVTVSGLSLAGVDAGNYTLQAPATLVADITPATLTVTGASATDKVYDTTSVAAVRGSLAGVLPGDGVTLGLTASFANANVGAGKTVSYTAALAGADAINYALAGVSGTTTASITPATLTYVATAVSAPSGQPIPPLGGTVTGFVGADTLLASTTGALNWTTAATPASAAGSYAVVGSGLLAANYGFVQAAGNASALRLLTPEVTAPSIPSTPASTAINVGTAAGLASVQVPVAMSTPTEGRVLDVTPAVAPAGDGNGQGLVFRPINLSQMTREDVMSLLGARASFKKKIFANSLARLEQDPALATVQACRTEAELSTGACVITEQLKKAILAEREARLTAAQAVPGSPRLRRDSLRKVRQAALPRIERKLALLIGVNDYADARVPQLVGAVPDTVAVRSLLEDRLGYETVALANPTREQIVRAFNQLALEAAPEDSVIVYYAGHGVVVPVAGVDTGFWLPGDVDAENPGTWLANSDIARMVAAVGARQLMLVSDSCYSGALVGKERVQLSAEADAADLLTRRAVIVMSSGDNEPVADEGREGHSVFAWHFMRALESLENWQPGNSLYERLRTAVHKDYPQTPQYGASRSAGHQGNTDYLFERRALEGLGK